MFKKMIWPVFVCLFAVTSVHAQGYGVGTPVEAKKMVEKAITYISEHGREKALKEFNDLTGKFQWRDLYVFSSDTNGVINGHPNPKLIGQNLCDFFDEQGKFFGKDIVEIANSRGSGWVDYIYAAPMTRQEEFKITYFKKTEDLIICCGAYLP